MSINHLNILATYCLAGSALCIGKMHEIPKTATEEIMYKCEKCDYVGDKNFYFVRKAVGEKDRKIKGHYALTH